MRIRSSWKAVQVQRAESQGQRLRECWHLKGWGRNLKEHEKETPEMERDLQKKWCHGNQVGEKGEGVAHRGLREGATDPAWWERSQQIG